MRNRLASGAAALGFLLASCTQTAPASQTGAADSGPKRAADQVIKVGTSSFPATLSPEGAATNITLTSFQFDNLLNFDKDFNLVPSAAEKWELLPDNTAWRFTLRKDLKFSNGDTATAEDVVFWVQTLLTPSATNTVGRQLLFASGAKVVDQFTFDITVRQRDFSLPYLGPNIFVVSKKAVEAAGGPREFGVAPRNGGTGPYELAEVSQGNQITWKAKSGAHPWRKPIASEIRWIVVPDQSQRLIGLQTGTLDMAIALSNVEIVDRARREGIKIDAKPDTYANIAFDQKTAMTTPLADRRVRAALNYAVDRTTIANTLYRGFGVPIGQLGVPGSLNYNDDVKPPAFDVARARQLLTEAGYPNGFRLTGIDIASTEFTPLYQAVQDSHRAVGVTYDIVPNEFAQYVAVALGQRPRKEMISAGGNNPNGIFSFTWQFLKCDQPPQGLLWCSQDMDRLLTQAYAEPNLPRRVQLLREAAKAWSDDYPMIFLIATSSFVLTAPKIEGFSRAIPAHYTLDSVYRTE
jgi:ABC-type transport system substrate-binding protein